MPTTLSLLGLSNFQLSYYHINIIMSVFQIPIGKICSSVNLSLNLLNLFVNPPKFIVRIIKVAECQLSQGINFHLCCCSIIIHGGRHNFIIEALQPKLLTMLENIFELNSFQILRWQRKWVFWKMRCKEEGEGEKLKW